MNKLLMEKWQVKATKTAFFQTVKAQRLAISELSFQEHTIIFHASLFQHARIAACFPNASVEAIKTWKLLRSILFRPNRLLAIILCAALWYLLSQTTFAITLDGEIRMREAIQSYLEEQITLPRFRLDEEQLQNKLKEQFKDQLNWLEVRRSGSRLQISYTAKDHAQIHTPAADRLIAQRDGVIAFFALQHGEKAVHINDFVKKGDVLVENVLINSNGKNEQIYVEGTVFAYTFEEVTVTMKEDAAPKPLQFYRLLFRARNEVSKHFLRDDRIEDENILQFQKEGGTITMTVLYTCYQDISTPR